MRHQHDPFHEGQRLWVQEPDGAAPRPAIYVGSAEGLAFAGGDPLAYVVFTDTREGAQVLIERLTPRAD